ncbi:flavodoxin family protein [Nonomuraea sp. ATR24]|uniref:flavodoxin family protein n=1 Tax=unclassified Nonomuraea TaxID=2593643 RepID=UPI0033CA1881
MSPVALVLYESRYGSTRLIAEAVAEGLATRMPAEAREAAATPARLGEDVTLLVMGAPTHASPMSRAPVPRGGGVREWLAALDPPPATLGSAAFDTRVGRPRLPGSAARALTRSLRRLGVRSVAPARSFAVTAAQGPPAEGELDRARRWGETLAARHLPAEQDAATASVRG